MGKKLNWSRDQSKLVFLEDWFRADGVHGHRIASDTSLPTSGLLVERTNAHSCEMAMLACGKQRGEL